MHKWNKVDPYNLDYIEKQVEAIKEKHNITSNEGAETVETRELTDIIEEQLTVLKQIQQVLENIEVATEKKGWKRFFQKG